MDVSRALLGELDVVIMGSSAAACARQEVLLRRIKVVLYRRLSAAERHDCVVKAVAGAED